MSGLLYADEIRINNSISVRIPCVGEVLNDEDTYFEVVSSIIATPFDMMVQLDDVGVDFTKINDFELFCLLLDHLKEIDTSLVLKGIDLKNFNPALNKSGNEVILIDTNSGIVIDRVTHVLIGDAIRKILMLEKKNKKPANDEAKEYLINKARRKIKSRKNKLQEHDFSELENLIIGLVNTEEFKYNYETVKDITLLQFYASLKQVSHKKNFDNTMIGYYTGTVKFEDLSLADRTWLKT